MTVSTTDSRISYNGNGVTTVFPIPFRFLANGDIVVVSVSALGVETTKALTTHYTLSGAGDDAGGTVTMLVAPASLTKLIIYRDTDIVQETDYISGDPFPAETHERALDRLTMIAQEIGSDADRAIKVPVGDSSSLSTTLPAAANRLDKFIVFDSATGAVELSTFTQTQVASAIAATYAAGSTADAVTFIQEGAGAESRSVQEELRETFKASQFGAVGDGVTDDTAAIELACATMPDNATLEFTPGKTYLVSFIWDALSDSDTTDGVGRGRAVCYFSERTGIRLSGYGATIKCVDHDIAADGGLLFAKFRKSPNCSVEGFTFDMTFTGYNELGAYYPICGGVIATDKFNGGGSQDALCSNFTVRDLTFKLYHPKGAFAITADPYGADYNNGYKIVSVFASGDSDATDYEEQSRGLLAENIRFKKGHNAYGVWGVAYNNATFRDIHAEAWVAASYTIATDTMAGVYYVAPVRFYQYYCDGLTVDNVTGMSLPWAERTGAFVGRCGVVSLESGLTTVATGGGVVSNCTMVLDNDDATLGGVFDVGIASSLSGNVRISNNSFSAWGNSAAVAIYAISAGGSGEANYSITNNISSKKINGPFVQVVNGNDTSDANRVIKSLTVCGNIVKGWGADGAVYTFRTGTTYYGVEHVVVTDNIFDGTGSTSAATGTAVDVRGRTSADNLIVTNNVIKGAGTPVQEGSATSILTDNVYGSNTGNGSAINYITNTSVTLATFAATEAVTWTVAVGDYHEYYYIEYTATNTIAMILAGVADSATGTIRTVAAGNTGKLTYKKIGNIK